MVPVLANIGVKRLQKILGGARYLAMLEMCILPSYHKKCMI